MSDASRRLYILYSININQMDDEMILIDLSEYIIKTDLLDLLLDQQNHQRELRKIRARRYYLKHQERLRLYSKNIYRLKHGQPELI